MPLYMLFNVSSEWFKFESENTEYITLSSIWLEYCRVLIIDFCYFLVAENLVTTSFVFWKINSGTIYCPPPLSFYFEESENLSKKTLIEGTEEEEWTFYVQRNLNFLVDAFFWLGNRPKGWDGGYTT